LSLSQAIPSHNFELTHFLDAAVEYDSSNGKRHYCCESPRQDSPLPSLHRKVALKSFHLCITAHATPAAHQGLHTHCISCPTLPPAAAYPLRTEIPRRVTRLSQWTPASRWEKRPVHAMSSPRTASHRYAHQAPALRLQEARLHRTARFSGSPQVSSGRVHHTVVHGCDASNSTIWMPPPLPLVLSPLCSTKCPQPLSSLIT
jgi:hypothetical protein